MTESTIYTGEEKILIIWKGTPTCDNHGDETLSWALQQLKINSVFAWTVDTVNQALVKNIIPWIVIRNYFPLPWTNGYKWPEIILDDLVKGTSKSWLLMKEIQGKMIWVIISNDLESWNAQNFSRFIGSAPKNIKFLLPSNWRFWDQLVVDEFRNQLAKK